MSTQGLYLLVLVFIAVCCGDVDWAHLDAHNLTQVNPEEFITVSAVNISSIPEDALPGLTSEQLVALNAEAV